MLLSIDIRYIYNCKHNTSVDYQSEQTCICNQIYLPMWKARDSISRQLTARTLQYQLNFLYFVSRGCLSSVGLSSGTEWENHFFYRHLLAVPYCGSCWWFRWLLCNNLSTDWLHNHVVDYVTTVPKPIIGELPLYCVWLKYCFGSIIKELFGPMQCFFWGRGVSFSNLDWLSFLLFYSV